VNPFGKLALMLRRRQVRFPGMPHVPGLPRVSVSSGSATKAVLFSILLSTAAVATGIFFAVKDVAVNSWEWPESGAAYIIDDEGLNRMGMQLPAYEDGSESHTLEARLAAGARLERLDVDLDMGKIGLTDCIAVERDANNGTGYLWVGALSITELTAPTLTLDASFIHALTMSGIVDGHTTSPTTATGATTPMITVDSSRGAGEYDAVGTVDRFLITLLGDAYVHSLSITGKCSVGSVDLDYIRAGTVDISGLVVGDDGNINTSALTVGTSTHVYNVTDHLIDQSIAVK
jgi:hypothetical protein